MPKCKKEMPKCEKEIRRGTHIGWSETLASGVIVAILVCTLVVEPAGTTKSVGVLPVAMTEVRFWRRFICRTHTRLR